MTASPLTKHCIRIPEAAYISGWSEPTVYRHLPFIKTYKVVRPGTTTGAVLIDYADFIRYIEKFAKKPAATAAKKGRKDGSSTCSSAA
jgi:hypothetical protein